MQQISLTEYCANGDIDDLIFAEEEYAVSSR